VGEKMARNEETGIDCDYEERSGRLFSDRHRLIALR
jgi:hypothetical protein